MNLVEIDRIFSTSFDQFIENLFRKAEIRRKDTTPRFLTNLGSFIELYQSSKQLEAKEHQLKHLLTLKDRLIQRLKRDLTALRHQEIPADEPFDHRRQNHFLAQVSHEIRTPLNGVIGIADLLAETPLTAEQQQYIDVLKRSSHSLLKLINDILDYSKIEAGQMTLVLEDFNLRDVLQDTVSLLDLKAQQKKLRLRYRIAAQTPLQLRGDPLRLRQILLNLVGNAVKFTEKGRVSITVGLVEDGSLGPKLRFAVSDTGIGIPKHQLDRLFKSFTQIDCPAVRHQEGTGLGLAISKELVTLMGGEIGVKSAEGKGSTFWFSARFGRTETIAAGVDDARQTRSSTPEAPLSGDSLRRPERRYRLLLVEDDPVNRTVNEALLNKLGCHVETAANGKIALQRLKREDFDLVLLDLQMPEMNGMETARRIRRRQTGVRDPGIPIIALTAEAADCGKDHCLAAGMDGYLTKPIQTTELKRMLFKHLEPAAVDTEAAGSVDVRPELPTLQGQKLAEMAAEIEDGFPPLVRMFLDHLPEKVLRLQEAFSRGDHRLVQEIAHQLKGNSANFFAEKLADLCRQIEDNAAADQLRSEIMQTLEAEAQKVSAALTTYLH